MLAPTTSWTFCFFLLVVIGGLLFSRRGAVEALGVSVALTFVLPVWLEVPIFGIPMDLRTCVAIVALVAFFLRDPRQVWSPLTSLDLLVGGMVIIHVSSDVYHGRDAVLAGLLAYGEWAIPYVAGRYAMRSFKGVELLATCLCGVVVVLSAGGVIEMFSGVNPWEVIFGNRPIDGVPRDASRYGFKRAFGTTLHPIYFGLLVMICAPWSISLARWAKNGAQRSLAVCALITSFAGVFSSLSRGPILAMGAFTAVFGGIWSRWCRWGLGILLVAFLGWVVTDFNGVVSRIEKLGGEKSRVTKLKLDGDAVVLSSSRHRILLLQVYWPAMSQAGWLGYGSDALREFPPRVPYLPADEATRNTLKYVDNAYVFYILRFGWTGASLFSLLFITGAVTGIRLSWDRSIGVLAGSMAAMIIAVASALTTVWFSYDMGFEVLWSCGVLAGMASTQRN